MLGYGILFFFFLNQLSLIWSILGTPSIHIGDYFLSSNYNLPKCCFPHLSCSLFLWLEVFDSRLMLCTFTKAAEKLHTFLGFFECYTNIVYSPRQHYQTVLWFCKIESLYVRFENKNLFGYLCFYQNALFLLPVLREAEHQAHTWVPHDTALTQLGIACPLRQLNLSLQHPRALPASIHLHISDYDAQSAQMTPHWERRQICWRKEAPHRHTLTVWKTTKPTRSAWSLTKINAKCCTWDAAIPHSSWRHTLGGPDWWQLGCVSAGYPSSSESKPCHQLH